MRKIHRNSPSKVKKYQEIAYSTLIGKKLLKERLDAVSLTEKQDIYKGEDGSFSWFIPSEDKQQVLWVKNFLENNERFLDVINPGDTIIEVGAATGEYTIPAAQRLEDGTLHAFEPEERNYKCLEENISLNSISNIKAINKIVSNNDNENKRFRVNRSSIADHTLDPEEHSEVISHDIDDFEDTRKKTLTLDTYCDNNEIDKIDILKVTANKHELEVLEGSEEILDRTKYVILNSPYEEVVAFLEDHGLSIVEIEDGKPMEKSSVLLENN